MKVCLCNKCKYKLPTRPNDGEKIIRKCVYSWHRLFKINCRKYLEAKE